MTGEGVIECSLSTTSNVVCYFSIIVFNDCFHVVDLFIIIQHVFVKVNVIVFFLLIDVFSTATT